MLSRIVAAVFLAVASLPLQARGAEVVPPGPVPRDSFAQVTFAPGDSMLGVVGIRDGQFVQLRAYADNRAGVLIFNGPPGSYLVHGVENGQMVQLIVTIGGATPVPPGPTPPGPGPGPAPDNVSNVMGVGHVAYTVARAIGDNAGAARLAAVFGDCALKMHQGTMLPVGADAVARQAVDAAGGKWPDWYAQTMKAAQAALDKHGTGIAIQKNVWREIQLALEAAAK